MSEPSQTPPSEAPRRAPAEVPAETTGVAGPEGPEGPAGLDGPDGEAPEREGTAFVQVTRRRAPRFRAFAITGLVLALVVAAVIAASTPPSGGYSQRALFGYLFCSLGLLGVILGGLVAVLLDRRTGTRPGPRARRRRRG